jgi:membrane-bound lytic murein transglycosylase MltF
MQERWQVGACATVLALLPLAAGATEPPGEAAPVRQLAIANKPWKGDFDRLLERRMIRVLVPYSRTLYYVDKGRERGVTADAVREFEQWINQKYTTGQRPITVYLVPTTRDKLLQGVVDGLGDIAAGNLTVTPERQKLVDFALQTGRVVREVVVTGAKAPPIASLDEIAGRTVHVRPSSSYHESLGALNQRFRREGKPEVVLNLVPDALEDEDMMEMANAGLIDLLVVDDWKARLWAQMLPRIVVREKVCVQEGGQIGWAIRKGSPKLQAAFRDYHSQYAQLRASWADRLAQAMRRVRQINDPTRSADWKRFQALQALFRRYGERYGFDPLMLTAQGYQESKLDQSARSHVGAIGVMQLMPGTASWLGSVVGRTIDPTQASDNVEGGVAYLAWLLRHTSSTTTAIGAYYQGLASVRRRGMLPETKRYVASVLALLGRV